jgi:hypothetical protein
MTLLKKYWFIPVIIAVVVWFSIRERLILNQSTKIAELEMSNFGLNNDRQKLELLLKDLKLEYIVIDNRNDSLKGVLKKYQKELRDLKIQHAKELTDILSIPPDTVYKLISARFPNYDNTDQRFRFAGSQILPMYSAIIAGDMVQQEYILQGKSLNSCLTLNDGFEIGIINLEKQIGTLKENVLKCDLQVGNYQKEVVILKKQIKNRTFWSRTLLIGAGIMTGIAIIK